MPKVLDKPTNSAADLLMPRRPSPKMGKGEQSFEHALKNAQPKRETPAAAKSRSNKPENLDEKTPVDPGAVSTDQADESPLDATTPVAEEEAVDPETVGSQDEPDAPDAEETDTTAPTDCIDAQILVPIAPLPTTVVESVETDTDALAQSAVATSDPAKSQLATELKSVEPAEADEPDAQLASATITSANLSDDLPSDEDAEPVTKSAIPVPLKATESQNAQHSDEMDAATVVDDSAIPMNPADSDGASTDDQADPNPGPKLKAVEKSEDSEDPDQAITKTIAPPTEPATSKDQTTGHMPARNLDVPAPAVTPPENRPTAPATPPPPVPVHADAEFATTNHDRIVTSVRSQLMPNGGSMHIRLDPPELGALQIHVRMVDGVMQASFETSNDQATRLLSHTLSQLKTALETQGVNVEKLQVQQSPRDQQASADGDDQQRQSPQQESQAQREQQRREMMNRMWRRIRLGRDPLDMVA